MPATDRKLRVFLCQSAPKGYASQDKPIVREFYQRLLAVPQGDDKGWIEVQLLRGEIWLM